MRRLRHLGVATLLISTLWQAQATAAEPPTEVLSIELSGDSSTRFEVNGYRYAGPLTFTVRADGISMTEAATIEQYLFGITEMPFSWHSEALAAQAVAARTYLARSLLGGRSGAEVRYGYDICATSRCQVYRGVQNVESDAGERWRDAVESTAGEVLLYAGRPIEAVYSSMVGSRSRANQDVWASSRISYLQPVDSPEIGIAPFAEWVVEVTGAQFIAILRAAGYDVGGALKLIAVDDPPEGEGRTTITVRSSGGVDSFLAPRLKRAFNIYGDDLFPGVLPVRRGGGRVMPQNLLSYTFEITHERVDAAVLDGFLPEEERTARDTVRIEGEGWGHGVGMSQWGARIMADRGATYAEILSHYYTGTVLELAPSVVPVDVVVGLDWGRASIPVTVIGAARVSVNGLSFGSIGSGEWVIRSTAFGIDIVPADAISDVSLIGQRRWPR